MNEPAPCPGCGETSESEDGALYFYQLPGCGVALACECGWKGPFRRTRKAALRAWDKRKPGPTGRPPR